MTRDRRMQIALVLSLALNVLIVVAVVSALAFAPDGRRSGSRPGASGGPPELQAFSRALDAPRRDALRERLRADPELRSGRARIGESRRAVVAALRADPFDAEALRAAMRNQHAVQSDLATRGIDGLVDVVESLTPAERAAFVAALEDTMRRRR
ncbi:periplasmic heavy metal sensor [Jannaschia sp. 2305UL9-9]|uniref:periplasmic heavy metal sensor n=1 Tax=Jannaschia sp. 2305UL9-9 TaxID=3121638 RepID=UPI003528C6C4